MKKKIVTNIALTEELWEAHTSYSVLGKDVHSFYNGNIAYVRATGCMREWSDINVGVHQACIMSSWLFNDFMDEA